MTTVNIEVPPELDPEQARQWLQHLMTEQASLSRIRTFVSAQATAPGPGTMAQIALAEQKWRDIERRYGLLDSERVARLAGLQTASRSHVHNLRRRHGLLATRRGGRNVYPGFQLTPEGRVQPWLQPVTAPLRAAGWSEDAILLWLAAPTGALSGEVPVEVVDGAPDRVVAAATAIAHGTAG